MKRHQAFLENKKMLKGGLHCHTTRSDGAGTPEEVIRLHKDNGYDFLAITDHRIYNFRNFAPDTGITIIPGMEFDNIFYRDKGYRCFHTVCIGPSKEDGNPFEQDEIVRSVKGLANNQEEYQAYLDDFHSKKNLTFYCHPEWSATTARDFEKMRGDFAMEIWNSGCALANDMDKDAAYWDELLGQGSKIFGVATDDGHSMYQHCKGWVVVSAENNINSILSALEQGKFYSSCGPEIYDFYEEDGKVVVECSSVSTIRLHSFGHPTFVVRSEKGDLTRAEFNIVGHWSGGYNYVRITIIDKDGHHAWTNPIFL